MKQMLETDLEVGDFARDEQSDEGDDKVVVLEVLDERADEHVLFKEPDGVEHTVAGHRSNREKYDPECQVVAAVYAECLDRVYEGWTVDSVYALAQDGDLDCRVYHFPHQRLDKIEVNS